MRSGRVRIPKSAILGLFPVLLLLVAVPGFAGSERTALVFYYSWYANPVYNADWQHWQEYNHHPPLDLASSYFPQLGPYSSSDPYVITRHMSWISSAGIEVLVYSWWGRSDPTDSLAKTILDFAADYHLKVAFMIEPYPGRSGPGICDDIEYLYRRFGNHPAFYRTSRKTSASDNPRPRGMFLIYQPDIPLHELQTLADQTHGGHFDSVLLLQSTDVGLALDAHFDGLFAYEASRDIKEFYPGIMETARRKNLLFVPCVSPGFNVNRTYGPRPDLFRGRRSGRNYDEWWSAVLSADPELVGIVSFNEWHEGTQIEPAIRPRSNQGYSSYEGSYRKHGTRAAQSYLRRTARWIRLWNNQP
jgi:glycoprotein endo-alpha-1,2-mannosidase